MSWLLLAPTLTVVGRQSARQRGNDLLTIPRTLTSENLGLNLSTYPPVNECQLSIDRCGCAAPRRVDQSTDIGGQGCTHVVRRDSRHIVQILLQEARIIAFAASGGCRGSHETGRSSYRTNLENALSQHA
jgi:hypothetical protein